MKHIPATQKPGMQSPVEEPPTGALISDTETTVSVPRAARDDRYAAPYVARGARRDARDDVPCQLSALGHLTLTAEPLQS
jgi:hypothetical protein